MFVWPGKQKLVLALLAAIAVWGGAAWGETGRAVVVVGPVDPPAHTRTHAHIAEAELVARVIERAGYHVERLYHPQATWERVLRASHGAGLFVYYGHGNGYGWMGRTDSSWINGLCLSDPENPDVLQAGKGVPGGNGNELASLDLGEGSTVALIHTCYAAGSSQNDWEAVDYETARARVLSYADAFFQAGAAHYLATNYMGVAPYYFGRWARGQPLESTIVHRAAAQSVHSTSDLLLIEARNWPDDPRPWVSAWVERPVQLALAGADELPSGEVKVQPARRELGGFGDWRPREREVAAPVSVLGSPEEDEGGATLGEGGAWEGARQSALLRRFCRQVLEHYRGRWCRTWAASDGLRPRYVSCCPARTRGHRGGLVLAQHSEK